MGAPFREISVTYPPQPPGKKKSGLSTGQIIGLGCGIPAGLVVMLLLFGGCMAALSGPTTTPSPSSSPTTQHPSGTLTDTQTPADTPEPTDTPESTDTPPADTSNPPEDVDVPDPDPDEQNGKGLPPPPPDKDCSDFVGPVPVGPGDPHRLDRDGDGIGCES